MKRKYKKKNLKKIKKNIIKLKTLIYRNTYILYTILLDLTLKWIPLKIINILSMLFLEPSVVFFENFIQKTQMSDDICKDIVKELMEYFSLGKEYIFCTF